MTSSRIPQPAGADVTLSAARRKIRPLNGRRRPDGAEKPEIVRTCGEERKSLCAFDNYVI